MERVSVGGMTNTTSAKPVVRRRAHGQSSTMCLMTLMPTSKQIICSFDKQPLLWSWNVFVH